ncbi:MAG: hypothetical protein A2Y17_11135 [Clostridiales bacterium GWF2_38_85]|nr:MAG: hypothetical protein A2Y17_11135 [Clostridiales bacterium GWF2_38_85]HBL84679.1 hypothetical protein [Clostridiales bacterium]
MDWIQSMQKAISYIEKNILNDISVDKIAENAYSSSANFQRIFSIITSMTIGDYIRNRRLTLAGKELPESKDKIIDIALKYGYETAASFTKAFIRFHGITPSSAKKSGEQLKYFAPLSIQIDIKGGFNMSRKIIPNIPELNYDGNNAAYFTQILASVLQGMNESFDKTQITACSGEGNRFCWTDGAWVFGNECMESLNETPFEIETRILNFLGWKAKYFNILRDKDGNFLNTDIAQLRQEFVEAIDRGVAVMPGWGYFQIHYTIFFGYEDDGQKMIGWDYQKKEKAETFVWDDWDKNVTSYIILKEKDKSRTDKNAALETFQNIIRHARRIDEVKGRKVGFAAWESFLYHLEHDDFSNCPILAADAPTVEGNAASVEHRFIIYCDALCQIYARKEALSYYRSLAGHFPEWSEELNIATEALEACASYGGYLWSQGFSFDVAGYEKFKTPEGRKILADAGCEAMKKDIEAVEQFEKILKKEGL